MTFQRQFIDEFIAQSAAEGERRILWLPVFLAIGIAGYFALPVEPAPVLIVILSLLVAVLLAISWRCPGQGVWTVFVAAVLLGVVVSAAATLRASAPILSKAGWYDVQGRISAINRHGKGWRLRLDHVQLGAVPADATPRFIRVRVHKNSNGLAIGDIIHGRAILRPPPPPVMPGAFDFQRNAFFKQIGATGVLIGEPTVTDTPATEGFLQTIQAGIERWRVAAALRIEAQMPSVPTAGVAAALLVGKRGALDPVTLENIRAAGLAHILAISGLHMGMVAGFIFFILRAGLAALPGVALRWNIKKISAFAALLVAAVYLALSGAAPPAERAFLIILLALVGILTDRVALSMRSLALAAGLLLLVSPEILLGPSFQMSFAAAIALVALYESPWSKTLRQRQFRQHGAVLWRAVSAVCWYIMLLALSSLAASLATAPFVAYHFHELSLVGVVANLLAVPLTAFWVMPTGVLALCAMPFGLESLPLTLMGMGIQGILNIADSIADWPIAVFRLRTLGTGGVILFSLGALWLVLWQRRRRYLGIPVGLLGLLWAAAAPPPDILVSGDGRLAAVRLTGSRHAIAISSVTVGRFTATKWRQALGVKAEAITRFQSAGTLLECDDLGCVFQADQTRVGFSRSPAGQDEDCQNVDILISPHFPVWRPCAGPTLVLDSRDFLSHGAHAIWLNKDQFVVRTIASERGQRPWTGSNR